MQKSTCSMTQTVSAQEEVKKVKVVMVGPSGVGKTSISTRFVNNQFNPNSPTTLGASYLDRELEYSPGKKYKIQIWDTSGQEKYRSIAKIYYREAKMAILVYDINDASTLLNIKSWKQEVVNSAPKDIILALVGNKSDLLLEGYDKKTVETKLREGKAYADSIGAFFYKTSAKDNIGLQEMFTQLCLIHWKRQRQIDKSVGSPKSYKVKIETIKEKQSKKCCK